MTVVHPSHHRVHRVVPVSHHGPLTRVVHGVLALAVIEQLGSSLLMVPAEPGQVPNAAFEVHEAGGLVAFGTILAFWLTIMLRSHGTPAGLLFPWTDRLRLRDLWHDTASHLRALRRRRLPTYDARSPLASAVHGLGLLAISAMALTGALYWAVGIENPDAAGLPGALMTLHRLCSKLAWAYLIGHASVAVIYHFTSPMRLSAMWSLPSGSELHK